MSHILPTKRTNHIHLHITCSGRRQKKTKTEWESAPTRACVDVGSGEMRCLWAGWWRRSDPHQDGQTKRGCASAPISRAVDRGIAIVAALSVTQSQPNCRPSDLLVLRRTTTGLLFLPSAQCKQVDPFELSVLASALIPLPEQNRAVNTDIVCCCSIVVLLI